MRMKLKSLVLWFTLRIFLRNNQALRTNRVDSSFFFLQYCMHNSFNSDSNFNNLFLKISRIFQKNAEKPIAKPTSNVHKTLEFSAKYRLQGHKY